MKDTIKMDFVCSEDFDAMACSSRGRFCASCKKEVVDLTHLSVSEIRKMKEKDSEICGIMTIDQIDPNIITEIKVPKRFQIAAAMASIFINTNYSFGQHTNFNTHRAKRAKYTRHIELWEAQLGSDSTNKFGYDRYDRNQYRVVKRSKPIYDVDENGKITVTVREKYKSTSIYLSKRFPFIIKRKRYAGGRYGLRNY